LQKIEIFVIKLIIGAFFPLLLFLAEWWISIGLAPENMIFIVAFMGLL